MSILEPSIAEIIIPTPPPPPAEIAPVVWQSYGMLVQDYLDGRIQNLSVYYTPISVIHAELNFLKQTTFRKYHRARRDLLAEEGKKNLSSMPGYLQRKLMDMALDEKRELAEEGAKLVAKRTEESLTQVYDGANLAVKADSMRSAMHLKIEAMSFEVAKATVLAAYENARQRVISFGSQLKAIATNFELYKIEMKAQMQLIEGQLNEVKIQLLAAGDIGLAEELRKAQAELEVAKTQILEAESRLPLVQAEIDKAYANLDIMRAEQLLATFKELSAEASMEKSEARKSDIALAQKKIDLELEKIRLLVLKDETDTSDQLSSITARSSEEHLSNIRTGLSITSTESDAQLTTIKAGITQDEATAESTKIAYFNTRSAVLAQRFAQRGSERTQDLVSRTQQEISNIDGTAGAHADAISVIAGNSINELSSIASTHKTDIANRATLDSGMISTMAELSAHSLEQITAQNTIVVEEIAAQNALNMRQLAHGSGESLVVSANMDATSAEGLAHLTASDSVALAKDDKDAIVRVARADVDTMKIGAGLQSDSLKTTANTDAANIRTIGDAHIRSLQVDLSTHRAALDALLRAESRDIYQRVSTGETLANFAGNTIRMQSDGEKAVLVNHQAQIAHDAIYDIDKIASELADYTDNFNKAVDKEVDALVEAGKQAADAHVSTKYIYKKG